MDTFNLIVLIVAVIVVGTIFGDLSNKKKKFDKAIDKLQRENRELEDHNNEISELHKAAKSYAANLCKDMELLRNTIANCQKDSKVNREKVSELKSEVDRLETSLRNTDDELSVYKVENGELKEEVQRLESLDGLAQKTINNYKEAHEISSKLIKDTQEDLRKANLEINKHADRETQLVILKDEVENYKQIVINLKADKADLQANAKALSNLVLKDTLKELKSVRSVKRAKELITILLTYRRYRTMELNEFYLTSKEVNSNDKILSAVEQMQKDINESPSLALPKSIVRVLLKDQ